MPTSTRVLLDGILFPEGPRWHAGKLWFSDMHAHRVMTVDLAGRAEWTSALMRTRVETALTVQNRDLLASMDRRASIQLRLQETVEGLSVVAISYYAVGLLGYAAKPLLQAWGIRTEWFTAAAVALTLAATWAVLRLMRRRWVAASASQGR